MIVASSGIAYKVNKPYEYIPLLVKEMYSSGSFLARRESEFEDHVFKTSKPINRNIVGTWIVFKTDDYESREGTVL